MNYCNLVVGSDLCRQQVLRIANTPCIPVTQSNFLQRRLIQDFMPCDIMVCTDRNTERQ